MTETPEKQWRALMKKARSCQRTWGMGFPVISMELLGAYWDAALRSAEDAAREEEREACKKDVCIYCKNTDIYTPACGPNKYGSWTHKYKDLQYDQNIRRPCRASYIFERALAGEEGKG